MLTSRRTFIALGLGAIGASGQIRFARAQSPVQTQSLDDDVETHGLSPFGELDLPQDFKSFPYVNPSAKKGGILVTQPRRPRWNQNNSTFNTLNIYSQKGDGAAGMELTFDSLMVPSLDERNAMYGLVASSVRVSSNRLKYRFLLRKEARFHDGTKVTAADVAFSLNTLRASGHFLIQSLLKDMILAIADTDDIVEVRFSEGRNRDSDIIVAMMPVFSQKDWKERNFEASTLDAPLGSGPYRLTGFEQGRYVEFHRAVDYWAAQLPVNVGLNNFDRIRYDYFRDRQVAFEAFKTGQQNYYEDFNARQWALGYDFSALKDGRAKKTELYNGGVVPIEGWFFNTRREIFSDARIREAIGLAFDFEWVNKNIMYSAFRRISSFFQNTDCEAADAPSREELLFLDPLRSQLSSSVFGRVIAPPISDGSGSDNALLRRAAELLKAAGCSLNNGFLFLPSGRAFEFEILDSSSALKAQTESFIVNLNRLGIKAHYRIVDPPQFIQRRRNFDFDLSPMIYVGSLTPGPELQAIYGSDAARSPGSRNIAGIADPAVDVMLEKIAEARSRRELATACRALDRILRSGYYWVPTWWTNKYWVAYWQPLEHPEKLPRFGTGAPSTWWSEL